MEGVGDSGGDRLHLARIDADETAAGNQAFVFDGTTGTGHLWTEDVGASTYIYGNVDADLEAELVVEIRDGAIAAADYAADDFVL